MYTPTPFAEHFLPEEDGHKIYFAEYGNPDGKAIISVHGGPGSGSESGHAARFDLAKYRVILFDQRGCGKTESKDLLHENTIQKSASDMERIRENLKLDSWIVSGGSWGSSLSLFYAQSHPKSVKALLTYSIFLCDSITMDWFGGPVGASSLFSDVWEQRNKRLQNADGSPATAAEINQRLQSLDKESEEFRTLVADILNWEWNLFSASRDVNYRRAKDITEQNIQYARIFMHYESNNFFLAENQLLKDTSHITHIPLAIVHGRHDILCPFRRAWDLYNVHGNAEIVALPQSNHALSADGAVARKFFFQSFLNSRNL